MGRGDERARGEGVFFLRYLLNQDQRQRQQYAKRKMETRIENKE
jgi:hypothetical protein